MVALNKKISDLEHATLNLKEQHQTELSKIVKDKVLVKFTIYIK